MVGKGHTVKDEEMVDIHNQCQFELSLLTIFHYYYEITHSHAIYQTNCLFNNWKKFTLFKKKQA